MVQLIGLSSHDNNPVVITYMKNKKSIALYMTKKCCMDAYIVGDKPFQKQESRTKIDYRLTVKNFLTHIYKTQYIFFILNCD